VPSPLNHERNGSGDPLVLIHGLGGELGAWEPVIAPLARERELIAVDLPGFGASPPLPDGTEPTAAALGAAVGALLAELGIERAHLAGNSLGGWAALELAKAGRALSVTTLSPAGLWARPLGPRPGLSPRPVGRALLPLLPAILRTRKGRRLALASSVGHPERVPRAAALRMVRAYLTAPDFERANLAMRSNVFSGGDRISVPVTLAWSELDRLIARPDTAAVPGARFVLLPDCGHVPMWDDPGLVSHVLLEGSSLD
jgi:pimeloyl-ACP methyl ester carboxylesterase